MTYNKLKNLWNKYLLIFIGGYSFVSIIQLSQYTNTLPINNLLKVMQVILILNTVFSVFLLSKNLIWEWFVFVLGIVLLSVSYYFAGELTLIITFLMIFLLHEIQYQKILKAILIGQVLALVIILLSFFLGIIPDFISFRPSGKIRHSFGFRHYNFLGNTFFTMVTCYILSKSRKIKKIEYVFILILQLIIFKYTDGRTDTYLLILFLTGIYIVQSNFFGVKQKIKTKILSFVAIIGTVSMLVISFLLAILFSPNNLVILKINEVLTGRPNLWSQYFQLYNPTIFGQDIYEMSNTMRDEMSFGDKYLVLDNSYLTLFWKFGIVAFIIFFLFWFFMIFVAEKQNKPELLLLIFIMAIYGITSQTPLFIMKNVVLLCGVILLKTNRKKSEFGF